MELDFNTLFLLYHFDNKTLEYVINFFLVLFKGSLAIKLQGISIFLFSTLGSTSSSELKENEEESNEADEKASPGKHRKHWLVVMTGH